MKRLLTAVLIPSLALSAGAQSTKYGPLALRLPASARILAMANIGVTGRDDDVLFYNPAQLTVARGTSMSLARMSPDARGGTMSTALRLGTGGLGFGVNYLEYRAPALVYPLTRSDILDPNDLLGTSALATLGYGRTWKGNRVGIAANYASDQVGIERFRNFFGDLGIARDFARYYTGGLSLEHLGRSLSRFGGPIDPPMKAVLGVSASRPLGPLDVLASTSVSAMREGNVSGAVGAEVAWSWLSGYSIAGRAGVREPREIGEPRYTAGVGFTADRVSIDLTGELLAHDRVSYRAGFRVR